MAEVSARPDPDRLLVRYRGEGTAPRARLRIFFGFAPGVGKTFKMLEAARELPLQDVDLVVGCVETHGRYDTAALLLGLEVLPRQPLVHQGRTFEELDLDAILARRPKLVVIDELAHANVPGCRHPKRWQDVFELLDAGIDVMTTLNVQHVESLNDVVAQITGVRVRETVPDHVLDRADEIELVDVSPEELLARLRDGKIYVPDAAQRAREGFFKRGNLLALRELALRQAVDRVDAEVQEFRSQHEVKKTWGTAERIAVCVGPAPASAKLVRAARRMAVGLRASWAAIYVEALGRPPLSQADQDRLEANLRLVEQLGGEVIRLQGSDVSATILAYAREKNVTRLVIGKPTHSRLRDLLRGSLLDSLVRGSGEVEVHVISGDEDQAPRPKERPIAAREQSGWRYVWAVLAVALTSALGHALRDHVPMPDLAMLYLAAIGFVALRFARGPAIVASALSAVSFDFFFVPPTFSFTVSDARYVFTFATMFGVGFLISDLVVRLRLSERNAIERARQTTLLLALSRDLGQLTEEREIANVLARHLHRLCDGGVAVFLPNAEGELAVRGRMRLEADQPNDRAVVQWCFDYVQRAGRGTDTLGGARLQCHPIQSGAMPLGVVALDGEPQSRAPALLDSFLRLAAIAFERAQLAADGRKATLRVRTEELRSALLSTVSHDLRTPLGVITGAATTLRDAPETSLQPGERAELLGTICDESERLGRLLSNLLDMTRLSSGVVELQRAWVPLDELVGSAIGRFEARLQGRAVTIDLPTETMLISIDPVLFEQLLVNLLDNALKYTPEGTAIEVRASAVRKGIELVIADEGPGIPVGEERRIFERFYRGPQRGVGGAGLGLAICKAIVDAHGGTLRARNRMPRGAEFAIHIPTTSAPPPLEAAHV